jgi:hypothetical protein
MLGVSNIVCTLCGYRVPAHRHNHRDLHTLCAVLMHECTTEHPEECENASEGFLCMPL